MKRIICGVLLIALVSCSSKRSLPGNYTAKGKDYIMELQLRQDNTFSLLNNTFEVKKNGKGKWKLSNNDTLILRCINDASPISGITQDYLDGEELKLFRLKNGNFKYYKATFKKK